jgi:hypothetical protein
VIVHILVAHMMLLNCYVNFINIVNVMLIVLLRGFLNDLLYNGVRTSKARRC